MPDLMREIRFAVRSLIKSPGFTVASALALCLAIGANTAVFSVVHSLLTIPIPFEAPDRVAFLFATNEEQNVQQGGLSTDDFLDFRERLRSLDQLSAASFEQVNVTGIGNPQRASAVRVTPGFFDMSGVSPVLGRGFNADEGQVGDPRVALIGHGFWQRSLGGTKEILGQTVQLDGMEHAIVGVAPPNFSLGGPAPDVWRPLSLSFGEAPRDQRQLMVLGRLRPGLTAQEAAREAEGVASELAQAHPGSHEGWSAIVVTVVENLRGGVSFAVTLLYAAITLVLLIACVNIANLLLARALRREREIALRASLGASRWRIVRQLLIESVTLACIGGALGLLTGAWAIRILSNWIAPDPNIGFIADSIRMSSTVALHSVAVSALAGLIFGLMPAIQLARTDLNGVLREGGRSGESRRRGMLRSALVMGQVAMALALLITAGTLIRAFGEIYDADPGFETAGLLTGQVALPVAVGPAEGVAAGQTWTEPREQAAFFAELNQELASLPGVEGSAVTTLLPLTQVGGPGTAFAELEGRAVAEDQRAPNVNDIAVSSGYFQVLGVELTHGRDFRLGDDGESEPVALVSEAFLTPFSLTANEAVGARIRLDRLAEGEPGPWRRIVGIVSDHATHAHSLRQPEPKPAVYVPIAQAPQPAVTWLMRTRTAPLELAGAARETVWRLAPTLPVDQVRTLDQAIEAVDTQNVFFLRILSGLALVALGLAAVGIYGLITYSVNQRRREIGIRIALGARSGSTLALVARQTLRLTTAGLVLGAGLAFVLVRFMTNQLAGVSGSGAGGPATFAAVGAFFLTVALVASAWPAWRALRVDPAGALRED